MNFGYYKHVCIELSWKTSIRNYNLHAASTMKRTFLFKKERILKKYAWERDLITQKRAKNATLRFKRHAGNACFMWVDEG